MAKNVLNEMTTVSKRRIMLGYFCTAPVEYVSESNGIVHPKNLSYVIFYSPSSCSKQTCMNFFFLLRRYFEKWVTEQMIGPLTFIVWEKT